MLLYFLVRRLPRPFRRDIAHASTSIKAPLDSRRYEKPELTGEDARKEMDAAESRTAELPGEETRMEMDAAESRKAELPGEETRMEMEATPAER